MTTAIIAGEVQASNGTPGPAPTGQTPAVAEPSGQFTKEQVDKAFAAGLAKAGAEAESLKKANAELQASLSKTKPIEDQHKELESKYGETAKRNAELEARVKSWEDRQVADMNSRALKLPDTLRPAFEKTAGLGTDARLDVLASLEAAVPAPGAISPPGGNMGKQVAGVDIAAIAAEMNAANATGYHKALAAGMSKLELDKALAHHAATRR